MTGLLGWLVRTGEWLGAIATWAIALVVVYDVTVRALGFPTLWALEVSGYLMVGAAILAAGETLRHDGHFQVKIFVSLLPPRVAAAIDLVVDFLSMLMVGALFFGSVQLLLQSHAFGFTSPTRLHVPLIYPQGVLSLGLVLLLLAYIGRLVGRIGRLRRLRSSPNES